MYVNPVLGGNFADPGAYQENGVTYAYATGDLTVNLQVAKSTDLVHWDRLGEALPRLPFWQPSSKGLTWAPEVVKTSAGYVMYYVGRDVQAGKQCVAVAVAQSPEGPFVDQSKVPFLCQTDLGGSIDPFPFKDTDGSLYLLWKNDGNCCGMRTRIWIQPLSADGLKLSGKAVDVGENNDQPWEGDVVEAPALVRQGSTYVLFYSANAYDTDRYSVGYATSNSVDGPYRDATEDPVLKSADGAAGPGGEAIVTAPDGSLWMLYHAWDASLIGDAVGGERSMWLDGLTFSGSKPTIDGPQRGPQQAPAAP